VLLVKVSRRYRSGAFVLMRDSAYPILPESVRVQEVGEPPITAVLLCLECGSIIASLAFPTPVEVAAGYKTPNTAALEVFAKVIFILLSRTICCV